MEQTELRPSAEKNGVGESQEWVVAKTGKQEWVCWLEDQQDDLGSNASFTMNSLEPYISDLSEH